MPRRRSAGPPTLSHLAAGGDGRRGAARRRRHDRHRDGRRARQCGLRDPEHLSRVRCRCRGWRHRRAVTESRSFLLARPRPPQCAGPSVTRLVDRGLGPQAAVEAPRWLYGRTWGEPSKALRLESRFGDTVATALGQRGHDVRVVEPWSDLMGHAQCIALADGALVGGSDPRADGAALGCSSA
ncbi:MAG: hypothetical protein DME08_12610 [Candidatus Rokuibacteriota bacterium]|nr:MAG: hypothetical protein DME08_12610 [Candidatus Rokubacteria bacterium]